jgi:hypothetical protein
MRGGTWIASLELWSDFVAIRWAQEAPSRSERYIAYSDDYAPWHPDVLDDGLWSLTDDAATDYELTKGNWSGVDSWFRGEVMFSPAPPAAATVLRLAVAGKAIKIPLT